MHQSTNNKSSGFTLIEVMITLVIIAIVAGISAPAILSMAPNMALKSAAQDLYSSFQAAKVLAIKENRAVGVIVGTAGFTIGEPFTDANGDGLFLAPEVYIDSDGDGAYSTEKAIIFTTEYDYGIGIGASDPDDDGTPIKDWNDGNITPSAAITFNSRGLANTDSAFLINKNNDICYAITVRVAGSIKTRKYAGAVPFNVNNWTE